MKPYWFFFPVPLLIIGIGIYLSQQESSICDQFKPIFKNELKAVVTKKYYDVLDSRKVGILVVKDVQMNKEFSFTYMHEFTSLFEKIQQGDSLKKASDSYSMDFYHGNDILGTMTWDCKSPADITN